MVIIAAVDRSDRASNVVREAATLAEAFDDVIHVVYVLTRSEFMDLERTSTDETGQPVDMDRIREVAADIAANAVTTTEIPSEAIGLVGDPADRIISYANEQNARYIVVGPRKRSPAGKVLFGSVAQSILLNATCPVLISMSDE